ncbi:hypothetical protein CTAYLR_007851 [Chrysophaeum taylorii]|uniref:PDK1-type PH domain-containing protein n=1 Tax=Chrysophaeum taylorii TaxID=2483200 RepID=A0AAD7UCB7_9STRA|nr:hypothetical protein CTAYLR_007851 [Chrysophaeum taylorii]
MSEVGRPPRAPPLSERSSSSPRLRAPQPWGSQVSQAVISQLQSRQREASVDSVDEVLESPAAVEFEEETRCAIVLQSRWRRVVASREAARRREEARARENEMAVATIRVQSISRRTAAVAEMRQLQHERTERAAVRLQSAARSVAATRVARRRREQRLERADESQSAARAEQATFVTARRIARGGANERRRGRLTALLRRALPSSSSSSSTSGTRPGELVTAEVISPAEPLPPLANVEQVTSMRFGPDVDQLPHAQVVGGDDDDLPEPPPTVPGVAEFLSQPSRRRQPTTPQQPSSSSSSSVGANEWPPPPATSPRRASPRRAPPRPSAPPPASTPSNRPASRRRSRRPSDERVKQIGELAAYGPTADSRRGALALLADEHAGFSGGIAAVLALVRPLYDEDPGVRVEAVRAAHRLGSLELAQFALDDEAVQVRRAVLEALSTPDAFWRPGNDEDGGEASRRRLAALIVALMKALEDVSLDDSALTAALSRLRGALLATGVEDGALLSAPLEKAMQAQRSDEVRAAVVRAAGELRASDALRRVAIFDASPNVRRVAVEMLGWNGAARELRDFVLVSDDDATVRADALEWLARLDDATGLAERGVLGDRSAELRARAAELVGDVVSRRVAGAVPAPDDRGTGLPARRPAPPAPAPRLVDRARLARCSVGRLRELGYADATRALGTALSRDNNVGVRGSAAAQLARVGCVDELSRGLSDAHASLRLRVVELIGDIDDPEACCPPLETALRGDADEAVRRSALDRLGALGDPRRAIDDAATSDPDVPIRELAVGWLGRLSRADALLDKPLADARSADVRAASASALRDIFDANGGAPPRTSDKRAQAFRSALLMRLGDAERRVRVEAARALAALGERQWADVIKGDANDCARLAGVGGSKATAVLVFVLCNAAEGDDRVAAADALGRRDRDLELLSLNALCACCSEHALEPRLRVAALKALEALLYEPPERRPGGDGSNSSSSSSSRPAPRSVLPPDFYDRLDISLRKALDDKDHSRVRVAAANAVGASRCSGHSLEKLLVLARPVNERLKQTQVPPEPSADVRATCAKVLKRFGPDNRDAGFALLDALSDKDVTTRDSAAASFAGFSTAPFVEDLAKATVNRLLSRRAADDRKDPFAPIVRAAAARALGFLSYASPALVLPALHDALKADREPLVHYAVCVSLGALRSPVSLRPLLAPFRDKKNANVAQAAKDALANLDYSRFLAAGERVVKHAPVVKRSRKIFTTLKALVLTDQPRLFYVDADTLKPKNCDLQTLEVDNSGTAQRGRTLLFHLPGQGRVSVLLLFGQANEWVAARGIALSHRLNQPPPPVSASSPLSSVRSFDAADDDDDSSFVRASPARLGSSPARISNARAPRRWS